MLLLDTCALLWLTLDPSQLSLAGHKAIANSDKLLVSSISIWEIGIKATRRKLDLGMTYHEYVKRLDKSQELEIIPVDHHLWCESVMLDWSHRDPADRIIVALAKTFKAKIVTDDKIVANFYKNTIG